MTDAVTELLANRLVLGAVLDEVRRRWGGYELVAHWQQGEFHHDVVLRIPAAAADLGGEVLLIATNCNGGVKEILAFTDVPDRGALWHSRCPKNPDFSGAPVRPISRAATEHWFDPCELLVPEARSEYRAEFRERQCGGGWIPRKPAG